MTAYDVSEWADFANTVVTDGDFRRDPRDNTLGCWRRRSRSSGSAYPSGLPLVPTVLLIVTASVTTGFVATSANAWVLLVEIKR